VVRRIWKEWGGACRVIMTGGWGGLIWNHLGFKAVFDPDLTLKGIALAIDKDLRARRRGRTRVAGASPRGGRPRRGR